VPEAVALRAYEVYCALFGEQEALISGHCRGGFGIHELFAFLYARSFPREEWSNRFDEALMRPDGERRCSMPTSPESVRIAREMVEIATSSGEPYWISCPPGQPEPCGACRTCRVADLIEKALVGLIEDRDRFQGLAKTCANAVRYASKAHGGTAPSSGPSDCACPVCVALDELGADFPDAECVESPQDKHSEEGTACWCRPTVECPTCGLDSLCLDEEHVKVVIHRYES
jgi:hypothetical protein